MTSRVARGLPGIGDCRPGTVLAELDEAEALSRTLPEFSIGQELGDDAIQEASAAIRGAYASLLARQ